MSARRIRVLVVDDSNFVRKALARMLAAAPDIEVVGEAADGREGVEKACQLHPDVVTLDIKMPRMGGLEALKHIMTQCPVPVLILSSHTREGAEVTLRALELGAMDFVEKAGADGSMNLLGLADELLPRIRALASVRPERLRALSLAAAPPSAVAPFPRAEAVAIGASTGGPSALQAIIPRLPPDFGSAVLVVQHMPAGFTRSLAERLDGRSFLPVREAEEGDAVTPGVVLIAPGGKHLKLRRRSGAVRVVLDDEPKGALHRPSVDVLMASVAAAYGARSLGIVLTGMGADGVEGLRAIRKAGGRTLAESEESCVIYGMPKAALDAGVVDRAVPLSRMADEIQGAV